MVSTGRELIKTSKERKGMNKEMKEDKKEVYCVFEKLENYYDDNNKALFDIVDSEEKAIALLEKYPVYNLFYEKWQVR